MARLIVLILIPLIIGAVIGYSVATRGLLKMMTTTQPVVTSTENPLLTNRSASANGKITKFENGQITLQNEAGQNASFKLIENALIFKMNNGQISSPSTDTSNISLNQPVGLNLTYVDGEYRVASITYSPGFTPPPVRGNPAASGSAIPAN